MPHEVIAELRAELEDYLKECQDALESASHEEFVVVYHKAPVTAYRIENGGYLKMCRVTKALTFKRLDELPAKIAAIIRSNGTLAAMPRRIAIKETIQSLESCLVKLDEVEK